MSKKNRQHQPKIAFSPPGKQPRAKENPGSTDQQTPAWQFHRCDEEHQLWGWGKLNSEARVGIIRNLCDFERMTWTDIKSQSGGKGIGKGTNHHSLQVGGFHREAIKRLEDLKLDDLDDIFSLRLGNTIRLYGIKDGRVMRFIWHDPHHGSERGAYPTK